jgi:hypothetical protein
MSTYTELLDHINTLTIVDTHEHLPFEADRSPTADVLEEWLTHYFSCDLVSAGLSDEGLAAVRDSSQDLQGRWKIAEPYWHAARDTGYGRALTLSAQGLYGIDEITADTIGPLNEAFKAARKKGGHYDYVLKEKSRIAVSIRDAMPDPYCETADPFVFTMQMGEYISPTHYCQMRAAGEKVGVGVHTLNDWMDAAARPGWCALRPQSPTAGTCDSTRLATATRNSPSTSSSKIATCPTGGPARRPRKCSKIS